MNNKRAEQIDMETGTPMDRRYSAGAEVCESGVSFRVWAPLRIAVTLVLDDDPPRSIAMRRESSGYFQVVTSAGRTGSRYHFRLDDDATLYPDPASRFQPEGPHGPSQVVDPSAFQWTDRNWRGLAPRGQVIYELHIGTFTTEGTWEAAAERLADLADVGVTAVEVLPVADFSGEFGWGYDGVDFFAPTRLYGSPDDFRRFVDRAHALGIGVILDVVYNHFGPDGNYAPTFSPLYLSETYENEWGDALSFDEPHAAPVRDFVCSNAAYWIDEYHLDGLRLDATQSIHDASTPHVLSEITRAARAAAGGRSLFIVAENEPQRIEHVLPIEAGGYGMDGLWNDDMHHAARVALLGRAEAYYSDYRGTPQEFISAAKRGYLYQGQWYSWQKSRRGTSALRIPPERFVTFIENHDQVANTGGGQRLHQMCSPGAYRAVTAYLLLAPGTPMLFQGQEFASTRPFLYFADHSPDLAAGVLQGRKDFLKQFPSLSVPEMQKRVRDPDDRATFEDSQLDWAERRQNVAAVALHRDLLTLRRSDPVLSGEFHGIDGAVLTPAAFVLRFFAADSADRLLLINLGCDASLLPAPEPLLAEPFDHNWQLAWSSEDPAYGGFGTPDFNWDSNPLLPGRCALFFTSRRRTLE